MKIDINLNGIKDENKIKTPNFNLSNKNASREAIRLMDYFYEIHGKGILSGQHCNKSTMPDIEHIRRVSGKIPAILGFDLLSYSKGIETKESDFECIDELANNKGTVEAALYYAKNSNAIITFCWHWFSPMHGRGKSFYTENTDFDCELALIEGTEENKALMEDLDLIAEELKKFKNENIPVLWRPLHEAEGGWFWWGAKGSKAYKKLYRLMYHRYVNYHKLNNLIWVYNAPREGWYPGDDVVDINSIDCYVDIGNHESLSEKYIEANKITNGEKLLALGENGPIPDPDKIIESNTPWLWFMTWNNFVKEIQWNSDEELKKFYNNPYVINLENLSKLR